MRRLSRAVPGFTFMIVVAVSPAHAQSIRKMEPSVWAKVCGKGAMTSKNVAGLGAKFRQTATAVSHSSFFRSWQFWSMAGELLTGVAA
jgi:hypothetical protein